MSESPWYYSFMCINIPNILNDIKLYKILDYIIRIFTCSLGSNIDYPNSDINKVVGKVRIGQ